MIRETQLEAYDKSKGTEPTKRQYILDYITTQGPASTFDLAKAYGAPAHCISGIITRLCDAGLLEDSGRRGVNEESGCEVILWKLSSNPAASARLTKREQIEKLTRQLHALKCAALNLRSSQKEYMQHRGSDLHGQRVAVAAEALDQVLGTL